MKVIEVFRYELSPQQVAQFEQAISEAMHILDTEKRVISYEIAKNLDEPGKYIIRMEWESREDQAEYTKSAEFLQIIEFVKPFRANTLEHQFYQCIQAK